MENAIFERVMKLKEIGAAEGLSTSDMGTSDMLVYNYRSCLVLYTIPAQLFVALLW